MRRTSCTVCTLFLMSALGAVALERKDLVPQDADVVVHCYDIKGLGEQVEQSPLGKLWQDPEVKAFLGDVDLVDVLRDALCQNEDPELKQLEWEEIKMLQGEVVVAVDIEGERFTLAAQMAPEDHAQSLIMDRRIFELDTAKQVTVRKHKFQQTDIIEHITRGSGDVPDTSQWQAHIGSTLLMSEDRAWVEKCIVEISRELVTEPSETGRMDVDVTLGAILQHIADEAGDRAAPVQPGGMPRPGADRIMKALGLMNIGRLHYRMDVREAQLQSDFELTVEGGFNGIFTLLDARPSSVEQRLSFVPADAYSYSVSRMDLGAFWNALPGMVAQMMPEGDQTFPMMLAAFTGMLGVNPAVDLVPFIDTQYLSFSSGRMGKEQSVTALRLKDEAGMAATLARLFAEGGMLRMKLGEGATADSFLGVQLYTFQTPGNEQAAGVAVAGGYLLIGHAEALRESIRMLKGTAVAAGNFYDSAAIRTMRRLVPPGAFSYSVFDWEALARAGIDPEAQSKLQEAMAMSMQRQAAGGEQNAFQEYLSGLDYSKLPSGKHCASFFGPVVSFGEENNGRLHWRTIMQYPAGN